MVAVSSSSTGSALVTGGAPERSASGAPPPRRTTTACFRLAGAPGDGNAVGKIALVHDDLGGAVFQDVAVLGELVPNIERDGHRAEPRDGKQHDDEFDAVRQRHRDAVAFFDPERPEAGGHTADRVVELAIADALVAADQGGRMRAARDRAFQHRMHAFRALDEAPHDPVAVAQFVSGRRDVASVEPAVHGAPLMTHEEPFCDPRRGAQWIAAYMIFSSVASSAENSSTTLPCRETRIRSDRAMISGR